MNGTANQPSIPRQHFESSHYREMAQVIQPNRALFDEWVDGMLFIINRIPEAAMEVDGIRRVVITDGHPHLVLYYCFDDHQLGLLGVEEDWDFSD